MAQERMMIHWLRAAAVDAASWDLTPARGRSYDTDNRPIAGS